MIKDNLIGLFGMLLTGTVSIYALVEKIKPVLGIIGLLVSIGVGITVLILNISKIKKIRMEKRIDEMILKHPEIKIKKNKSS